MQPRVRCPKCGEEYRDIEFHDCDDIEELRRQNNIMRKALERINRRELGATPDLTMACAVAYQALKNL